jgi:NADPH-dependent ferric siderophore reductase
MAAAPGSGVIAVYRFFELEVAGTRRVSPGVRRVTFRAARPAGLAGFASGGRDQRLKLFFPRPGQDRALVPVEAGGHWYAAWRGLDPDRRAYPRTYTVREQRREPAEVDIDFTVHPGAPGPAGAWAGRCLLGDRLTVLGPAAAENAGIDFRPPRETDWVLLAGDESALPAIAGILAWLRPGTVARVWIEIGHGEDAQDLRTRADAEITWLMRGAGTGPGGAIRAARLPDGLGYAWVAGEAGQVRLLRRHLVDRGFDRRRVAFRGYWRRGASEEDLLAEITALAGATELAGRAGPAEQAGPAGLAAAGSEAVSPSGTA